MGLLPKDYVSLARQFKLPPFIPLFNNGASLGMIFRKLDGHEKVRLTGMTPMESWSLHYRPSRHRLHSISERVCNRLKPSCSP